MNALTRRFGILLAGVVFVGLLAGIFLPKIEAALTLRQGGNTTSYGQTQNTIPTQAATVQPTSATTGTTPVATINTLAQDTFQRTDQAHWGTASDGQTWMGIANSSPDFSIAGGVGLVQRTAAGQSFYDAILGPTSTDAEVVFSGSINHLNPSNLGAVLRWSDTNNYYKAYIDGTSLILIKHVSGIPTTLKSAVFSAIPDKAYTLRFRIVGTTLMAKAWATGTAEPPNWLVQVTDTSFSKGFGGLRLLLVKGDIAKITQFSEVSAVTM